VTAALCFAELTFPPGLPPPAPPGWEPEWGGLGWGEEERARPRGGDTARQAVATSIILG